MFNLPTLNKRFRVFWEKTAAKCLLLHTNTLYGLMSIDRKTDKKHSPSVTSVEPNVLYHCVMTKEMITAIVWAFGRIHFFLISTDFFRHLLFHEVFWDKNDGRTIFAKKKYFWFFCWKFHIYDANIFWGRFGGGRFGRGSLTVFYFRICGV